MSQTYPDLIGAFFFPLIPYTSEIISQISLSYMSDLTICTCIRSIINYFNTRGFVFDLQDHLFTWIKSHADNEKLLRE